MTILVIAQPEVEPLTLAEARLHLRITATTEDDTITRLIKAARLRLEKETGRAFIEQTLEYRGEDFPGCAPYRIKIPRPCLIELQSIKYLDVDGVLQTVGSSNYDVIDGGDWESMVQPIATFDWPQVIDDRPDAVRLRFRAGWEGSGSPQDLASNIPDDIKQAMLLLVGHWFENREQVFVAPAREVVQQLPDGVSRLTDNWTVAYVA